MLKQLGQHISAARERARQCRERALLATDETLRAELAELEKRWLELAKQFEALKSMDDFLLDSAKPTRHSFFRLRRAAFPNPSARPPRLRQHYRRSLATGSMGAPGLCRDEQAECFASLNRSGLSKPHLDGGTATRRPRGRPPVGRNFTRSAALDAYEEQPRRNYHFTNEADPCTRRTGGSVRYIREHGCRASDHAATLDATSY